MNIEALVARLRERVDALRDDPEVMDLLHDAAEAIEELTIENGDSEAKWMRINAGMVEESLRSVRAGKMAALKDAVLAFEHEEDAAMDLFHYMEGQSASDIRTEVMETASRAANNMQYAAYKVSEMILSVTPEETET